MLWYVNEVCVKRAPLDGFKLDPVLDQFRKSDSCQGLTNSHHRPTSGFALEKWERKAAPSLFPLMAADDHFLTINEVCKKVTASRAWIYQRIAEGKFPKQIQLSARRVVWTSSSIREYMSQRVDQSKNHW